MVNYYATYKKYVLSLHSLQKLKRMARLDNNTVTNLSLIGFAGILVAAHGIVEAAFMFYVPSMILHFLCTACFVIMFIYLYDEKFQSKHFFQSMIAVYGLILILQGIVFPVEGPVRILNVAGIVLSLSTYCCLISVNTRWREVNVVKRFLAGMLICEAIYAAFFIYDIYAVDSYVIADKFIAITGVFMRPLIAICFSACYLARMKKKKEEGTLI